MTKLLRITLVLKYKSAFYCVMFERKPRARIWRLGDVKDFRGRDLLQLNNELAGAVALAARDLLVSDACTGELAPVP